MKLLFLLLLVPSISIAGPTVIIDGKLTWSPVTENTDNTPITGTVIYNIYCDPNGAFKDASGFITPVKSNIIDTSFPLVDLGVTGKQVCAVTASTAEGESYFSNTVNFTCQGQCLYGFGPKPPVINVSP